MKAAPSSFVPITELLRKTTEPTPAFKVLSEPDQAPSVPAASGQPVPPPLLEVCQSPHAQPKVTVEKQPGGTSRIIIQCVCGQTIELECE